MSDAFLMEGNRPDHLCSPLARSIAPVMASPSAGLRRRRTSGASQVSSGLDSPPSNAMRGAPATSRARTRPSTLSAALWTIRRAAESPSLGPPDVGRAGADGRFGQEASLPGRAGTATVRSKQASVDVQIRGLARPASVSSAAFGILSSVLRRQFASRRESSAKRFDETIGLRTQGFPCRGPKRP
jgi:hypothetical protein